jgi:fatty acid synthase, animal type
VFVKLSTEEELLRYLNNSIFVFTQYLLYQKTMVPISEDAVVISGIAGRFPMSVNVHEFGKNLLSKKNLTSDDKDRMKASFPGHPKRFGFVGNLEKFDGKAFSYPDALAAIADPQGRALLEHAYEAIIDAGISPESLRDSNTAVVIGCFNYDSLEHFMFYKPSKGFSTAQNHAFSLSNRISYCLGLTGPSLTVDTACSSSMYALKMAFNLINSGDCDSALVAGANLLLNPCPTEDMNV